MVKVKKIRLNIEYTFKFKKEKGENDEKNSSHIFLTGISCCGEITLEEAIARALKHSRSANC